jgi:O-antigen/teichoic acid export membrane protein
MPLVHVAAATVQAVTGFTSSARIRLVVLGARIVVLVLLFATDSLTIATLGLSMLLVSAVVGVESLRRVGQRFEFEFRPGPVRWIHFRSNLVYSAGISADALGNEGDKLVLAANRLVVDTGLYAAAYRIVQLGIVPVGSVMQATHARFLRHDEGVTGQHLARAKRYAAVGGGYGLVFAIGISLMAPLLPLVVGQDFEGSVEMVRWLSPIVLLRAVGSCSVNGLMGLGRVTLRTVLIAANAAFALVLYVVLIPRWGWEGAAIATVVSEALSVVMTWTALVVCQRRDDRALSVDGQPRDEDPLGSEDTAPR